MVRNVLFILCLFLVFATGINAGFVPEFELGGKGGGSSVYGGNTYTDPVTGMEFVWVRGVCYQMGSNDGSGDERPVHKVCIDDYYIGRYEVTQKQWRTIMGNNPSRLEGENNPVEMVSWNDIQKYIKKLNSQSGRFYRLPTEAEWEYAARGGQDHIYSGSNDVAVVAWYDGNSGGKTHPVGRRKANGFGLYDMSGNVWEWCSDWYGENYYSNSPSTNPSGSIIGTERICRGGCWSNAPSRVRVVDRYSKYPGLRYGNLGFRLVLPQI